MMTRYLIPFLLVLLLAGCSVNQTTATDNCCCQIGCSLSQMKLAKNLDKYNLHQFEQNLPNWQELAYWQVKHDDVIIAALEEPVRPESAYLQTLVSDEQLNDIRNLPQIQYIGRMEEIRNLIPEFSRHCKVCYGIHPISATGCE